MSTVICQSCGLSNDAGAIFCTECGVTMGIESQQPPVIKINPFQEVPRPRSFVRWGIYTVFILVLSYFVSLFLGVFFFASQIFIIFANMILRIPYAIYINQNFKDHRKLLHATHGYHLNPPDPALMAILYVLIPIIPIFFKYREFRGHLLKDHQNEETVPYSPYAVVGIIFVLPFLFSYLFVGLISFLNNSNFSFTIYLIISFSIPLIILVFRIFAEYKWQKSMNIHIQNHLGFLSK